MPTRGAEASGRPLGVRRGLRAHSGCRISGHPLGVQGLRVPSRGAAPQGPLGVQHLRAPLVRCAQSRGRGSSAVWPRSRSAAPSLCPRAPRPVTLERGSARPLSLGCSGRPLPPLSPNYASQRASQDLSSFNRLEMAFYPASETFLPLIPPRAPPNYRSSHSQAKLFFPPF